MRQSLITAHSGCMHTPPNSIASVWEGLRAGADLIEVDVRTTKDRVVVLLHDEHVSTPSGFRSVQDLTFEELKKLTSRKEIIRLEDILPLIREKNRMINLDVKEDRAIGPMIETVETFSMRDHVMISGCEKVRASYLKETYRPYQVLLNASANLFADCEDDYHVFVKETCRDAIAASCCGININYSFCREELLDYAGLRCLPVLVWTIDDPPVMEKFLGMGVHSITSNDVRTLMQLRDKRKWECEKV
ncbi:glycerophosphodiester phosphodiesterase [Fodinisporobacter ferrooxydans]|uniref:Glycerophosphodiester phosphodiesterase n=1 Tax=Fodinisporobacter ferrooxydans TaxID=2901836 RepID=A0ABY4CKA1_9BACL|nr:glycerophosphodiester phosphodiesterase [Alicyclobacillaceae bacterium MYW30-H2]